MAYQSTRPNACPFASPLHLAIWTSGEQGVPLPPPGGGTGERPPDGLGFPIEEDVSMREGPSALGVQFEAFS